MESSQTVVPWPQEGNWNTPTLRGKPWRIVFNFAQDQYNWEQLTNKRKFSYHPQIFWTIFYEFEKFSWFYMTIKLLCVLGIFRAMYSFVDFCSVICQRNKRIKWQSSSLPPFPGLPQHSILSTLLIRPTPPPQHSLELHLVSWRLIHNTKQI